MKEEKPITRKMDDEDLREAALNWLPTYTTHIRPEELWRTIMKEFYEKGTKSNT